MCKGVMALHFLVFYKIYLTLLPGIPKVSKVFLRECQNACPGLFSQMLGKSA